MWRPGSAERLVRQNSRRVKLSAEHLTDVPQLLPIGVNIVNKAQGRSAKLVCHRRPRYETRDKITIRDAARVLVVLDGNHVRLGDLYQAIDLIQGYEQIALQRGMNALVRIKDCDTGFLRLRLREGVA